MSHRHHHCHNHDYSKPVAHAEFAEAYSVSNQVIVASLEAGKAGGACLLEKAVCSSAFIDLSEAAASGKVIINKAGWYNVEAGISGALADWSLGLLVNGEIVSGGLHEFIHCHRGDYLQLANLGLADIKLNPDAVPPVDSPEVIAAKSAVAEAAAALALAQAGGIDAEIVAAQSALDAANAALAALPIPPVVAVHRACFKVVLLRADMLLGA